MIDNVPAFVYTLRVSAALFGLDTFLADAVATADAALVLGYGELVFLSARNISKCTARFVRLMIFVRQTGLKVRNKKGEACEE
jgi:hypothetical protein